MWDNSKINITGRIEKVYSLSSMFIAPNDPALGAVVKNWKTGPSEPTRKISICGKVEIDCVTGRIVLTDCDLDAGSRLFWEAVSACVTLPKPEGK